MATFSKEIKQHDPDSILLTLKGEFMGMDALNFESELIGYVDVAKKRLIMNFEEVVYIDSAALGLLIKATKEANENKKEVIILAPSENVMKVLKITHLEKALTVVSDLK